MVLESMYINKIKLMSRTLYKVSIIQGGKTLKLIFFKNGENMIRVSGNKIMLCEISVYIPVIFPAYIVTWS